MPLITPEAPVKVPTRVPVRNPLEISREDMKSVLDELYNTENGKFYTIKTSSNEYSIYALSSNYHVLAIFSSEATALKFYEWIDLTAQIVQLSLDEAIGIAKNKQKVCKVPVKGVALVDNMDDPKVLVEI